MERTPPLNANLVQAFVRAGHGNLEQVRALLQQEPTLVNAAWDWGGGDWETALGGAAHTGQREIALYLLAQGARLDLFAAVMLGQLDIVRATLAAFPHLAQAKGPHGIPLLTHAKMGGEAATAVVAYLQTLTP